MLAPTVSTIKLVPPPLFQAELRADVPSVDAMRNHCSACGLHNLCLPTGLKESDMSQLDKIIGRRRRVPRDGLLYRTGDPFRNLYAIKVGHFKTQCIDSNGGQQITGFQMPGELLGMDAIGGGQYHCDGVALEDSEVCEIPFAKLEALFADIPSLLHHFHRLMSQEITRRQNIMMLLSNMRADQRLAVFFTNLASRYAARGYSPTKFQLRMMREEIGEYLGLTIESISRLLSKFKKAGYIRVANRDIEILDYEGLRMLAAGNVHVN